MLQRQDNFRKDETVRFWAERTERTSFENHVPIPGEKENESEERGEGEEVGEEAAEKEEGD